LDLEAQQSLVQVLQRKGDLEAASFFAKRFETAGLQDFILDEAAIEAAHQRSKVADFEEIGGVVASFGGATKEVQRVVLLGVRETHSEAERYLRWFRPRRSRLALVEQDLAEALAAEYIVVEPELIQDYIHTSIESLFDFKGKSSRDVRFVTDVNIALDVDGVFVAQLGARDADERALPGSCLDGSHYQLQLRRLSGQQEHLVQLLANGACLEGGAAGAYGEWNYVAVVPWTALLLGLLFPVLRGWGQVTIDFKLPARSRALFAVRLSQRPGKVKDRSEKSKGKAEYVFERQLKNLERQEHRLQGDRMHFNWVAARRTPYYITVRGPLLDLANDQLIGEFLEERTILVKRGEHRKVDFNMCASEASITVKVKSGEEPVSRARLSFRGVLNSLRYVNDGTGMLYAREGEYVVVVGAEDRVVEIPVVISELVPVSLSVNLADEVDLVFKDCPDAVGPYLESDWAAAATALECAGQSSAAHRVRAELHRERGDTQALAQALEAAGDLSESAALRREADEHDQSALLYEEAGDLSQAADAYRAAGDLASAARCYENAYDWPNAIDCYQDLGETEKVLALMERSGEVFEAGCLAAEHEQLDRAIHNLQQVDARHPRYSETCRMLAEILERKGEMDLAAEKFDQAVKLAGGDEAPLELLGTYARLLEQAEREDEALSIYENIRRRDLHFGEVGTRIEVLRKRTTKLPAEVSGDSSQTLVAGAARQPATESRRYEILGELGRGGMGVVYKAKDLHLERIVALKVLSENLRQHQSALELFLREARSAAALNHRNIVIVYDAGQEGDMDFISMECLEGVGLDAILKKRGSLDCRTAASVALQVVAGLDYAQQSKIIHRDIKPSNLFVTKDRVVKIMDFGLAKMVEEVRRSSTVIGGTPNYMAPEQAVGKATDHRTDLYALGGTLFHLVTGTVPFEDGDVAYHHAHTAPPDARERELSVPAEMAELIMKLMAKNPDDRYQSAREVAAVLQRVLRD
ncbi:MAG: protein kinase, partial [Deltaproteobacteria bacterium]|nr:protein kinase [Deltaproteobacteria bacterium]